MKSEKYNYVVASYLIRELLYMLMDADRQKTLKFLDDEIKCSKECGAKFDLVLYKGLKKAVEALDND